MSPQQAERKVPVTKSVKENTKQLKEMFHDSGDFTNRDFVHQGKPGKLIFLETCVDGAGVQREILTPLQHHHEGEIEQVVPSSQLQKFTDLQKAAEAMINGFCLILLTDSTTIYGFQVRANFIRSIAEPENEKVIRGAREGFIESLIVNINLVRKHIINPDLHVKFLMKGTRSSTRMAILFMEGIANPNLVRKVEKRIESINVDFLSSNGVVEEFIEDRPFSPFPQILNTERPDVAVANLMEGRVVLLQEGNPYALILPCTIFAFYQSPDDYNSRWIPGSMYRLFRFLSFVIGLTLPAIYISVVAFHYELLPIDLLATIKASIESIPFPPLIEALIMEITIELIREAGVRLPAPLGPTIGIVGGLVIGTAVVEAGIVSNIMIIVVSITAVASFSVPSSEMNNSLRVLRFPLMFLAAFMGLLGVSVGITLIMIHLCTLESFGTPYLAPYTTLQFKDIKDTFFRFPMWKQNTRPTDTQPLDIEREGDSRGWKKDGI